MCEWTAEDELMFKAVYEGGQGERGFAWVIAADALQTYLAKEAERLTTPLNEGEMTLDQFLARLQPEVLWQRR